MSGAQALEDLDSIITFIADRHFDAAIRLYETIQRCAERLPDHPYLYREGRVPGTREAVVHPNYIVIYRVGSEPIEIVNVVHARRNYPEDI